MEVGHGGRDSHALRWCWAERPRDPRTLPFLPHEFPEGFLWQKSRRYRAGSMVPAHAAGLGTPLPLTLHWGPDLSLAVSRKGVGTVEGGPDGGRGRAPVPRLSAQASQRPSGPGQRVWPSRRWKGLEGKKSHPRAAGTAEHLPWPWALPGLGGGVRKEVGVG